MAPNQDRSMLAVFGSLTAVAAFLLAAVGIIVVVNDDGSSTTSTASAPVTVTLTEFKIDPGHDQRARGRVSGRRQRRHHGPQPERHGRPGHP